MSGITMTIAPCTIGCDHTHISVGTRGGARLDPYLYSTDRSSPDPAISRLRASPYPPTVGGTDQPAIASYDRLSDLYGQARTVSSRSATIDPPTVGGRRVLQDRQRAWVTRCFLLLCTARYPLVGDAIP